MYLGCCSLYDDGRIEQERIQRFLTLCSFSKRTLDDLWSRCPSVYNYDVKGRQTLSCNKDLSLIISEYVCFSFSSL